MGVVLFFWTIFTAIAIWYTKKNKSDRIFFYMGFVLIFIGFITVYALYLIIGDSTGSNSFIDLAMQLCLFCSAVLGVNLISHSMTM